MNYNAKQNRYENMKYNRCGSSGLMLPAMSLGLWHNFGDVDSYENSKEMVTTAFDLGITHFDLANNYGPPAGSAEKTFGRILKKELASYRDEMIISSKAGYEMWLGPYGNFGSRKSMMASLDQSLERTGLDYFDIFYSHRPDPDTPIEETMGALADIVKRGKALYVGISNYNAEETKEAVKVLKDLGVNPLIHQPSYSMFDRWIEDGLQDVLKDEGLGSIAYSPLAQGMLTSKYLKGIPKDSRADKENTFLEKSDITKEKLSQIQNLQDLAVSRNQSLAQMALAWVLRKDKVTSVIIGASKKEQIIENVKALENLEFSEKELEDINQILKR
ncbi:L-glyceraldehyde 3-phosphate reductase [Jeotgalibaca sp. MA1X17-3]|uniref:L-glyceraldehyde 3-phosphate reductase n=1 Tax=Jeotgalibaca sp. MA1X17-3 TaxID=2908211 RepID=UPI001F2717CB|nr:L-glyceraldehyde 3-phosphate reductase [Jeotgalibaca sp. MA1X17-3]UJF16452.1 L-glyceraldehyde 3-phosphate reductase [Jeotgalibaca sp. MA1X17-3]